MTEFELLQLIGEADDRYIMDSRRRPKKKPRWPYALAACLVLAVLTGAGVMIFGPLGSPATAESTAAGEAVMQADEEQGNGQIQEGMSSNLEGTEETTEVSESVEAYDVTMLSEAVYPESISAEDYDAATQQWTENQVSENTRTALNAFAYSTAAAVLQDQENSGCYSPLSLYQTLAILASGAQGQTRDELLSLLGQSDVETMASETGKLYRVNYFDNEVNKLKIANSLWLDETAGDGGRVSYNQDWVLSAAADYYASVYEAEFSQESTAQALGQWISDHTGGLLHPSPETLNFDQNTVMAIVNTLWYQTQWSEPFDEDATTTEDFTTADGEIVSWDFMHKTDSLGAVIETEEYTKSAISLNQGKMIFVLPQEGVDVDSLLTEEKLWEIFENGDYQDAEVIWSIPKFETSAAYPELEEMLQSLGVTSAFDVGTADFSLISSDVPLVVGQIQQETHIAINEDGVEAASFSMAAMEAGASEPEKVATVEMNLNRPFLYLITANDGSTLFLGVVRNPSK